MLPEATLALRRAVETVRAQIPKGEQTACEFQTAHEVMLWPLEIVEATLTGAPSDLPINRFAMAIFQAVVHYRCMSLCDQAFGHHTSDISGSPGH